MREALIALAIGALLAGCSTFRSVRHEGEGMYRVEAFFAEVEESHLQQLDLPWGLDQNGRVSSISSRSSEDMFNILISSERNRVDVFPFICLDPGQSRLVDMQRPLSYPIEFDDDGSTIQEGISGIGKLIEASIESEDDGTLILTIRFEETALKYWTDYTIGTENRTVRQPVISARAIGPSVLTVHPGQWVLMRGLIRAGEDGSRRQLIAGIRVEENR